MKASTFFTNSKGYLHTTSKQYLYSAKQWFFKTPERALNQAYNAALTIQSIEDEYFQGGKISTNSVNASDRSDYLMSLVRTDFEKELMIAKLRLTEFKASCLVLGIPVSAHLDKLSFLDGVLAKYISKENTSAPLAPLPPSEKIDSSQPVLATVGIVDVKTASDSGISLPKSLGGTIRKAKKELNFKAEAEATKDLQNSRNRISAAITGTAIKYILLLVVIPLMYQ
ncbi:MAG: hypothetical protein LDL41_17710, partial [Coleofasciculus sp. S288]|nr:hypothetical protein [Coleofasciculus sp. S288]